MSSHDDFRQALLDGEINASVTAHLETCADCARLAAALDRLEQASPALLDVHPPPRGLADRVLARVGQERARTIAPQSLIHNNEPTRHRAN
jgi:anti-sigma factor RsiW